MCCELFFWKMVKQQCHICKKWFDRLVTHWRMSSACKHALQLRDLETNLENMSQQHESVDDMQYSVQGLSFENLDCEPSYNSHPRSVIEWQESHGNRQLPCGFSWFCSHPVGPYLWDQEWMLNPYHDRPPFHLTFPPWHHSPSAMFYSPNDGSHLQQCWATSPLKNHIIIKSSLRGLQWDFC